jgi:nucleotide-binding universal stress UspA family protein
MGTYRTIVVGTDGSDTSLLAVERASAIARADNARLLIVTAYEPADAEVVNAAVDALKDDAYLAVGSAPAEHMLREATARAQAHGAPYVDTLAVRGSPVAVLAQTVTDSHADLLVVGNVGLNTRTGRLFGSIPQSLTRRAHTDVLIAHTSAPAPA